ncbi:MAG: hypothetical protein GF364_19575 [Candidatus Lokiarchaeota archaeon]|nr:hypothetical protein [Candidatus Lokiarchaeota archaeon]
MKKRFYRWRKDFGKEQLEKQTSLKGYLELWRQRLAIVVMVILGIGSLVFTPIALILIVFWLRVYFLTSRAIYKFEMILFIIAMCGISIFAILMPFIIDVTPYYQIIQESYYWLNISYFIGILLSSLIYLKKFYEFNLKGWKLERREKKIEKLEEKNKELEEKLKKKKKKRN